MKTKHLFFATALVASFASCTNDDIVEMQQGSNVERPTVDNVQLNFVAEGVDSRLTFGSNGYAWEADDVIGALNMDIPVVGAAEDANWTEKYTLKDFINTSYPFTYDAETKTWGTPGKMLEGNYFFAFPFTDYEGERVAKYSLVNQQQDGIKGAVVAKNYADNQVFVGYTPIKKGTGFDILTDIEMTSLLGAVQLRIKNEGEKTYHINKVVLQGTSVKSSFVLDPTDAAYKASKGTDVVVSSTMFNFANYIGDEEAAEYDKLAEDEVYDRMEALRAVADFNGTDKFVQLFINGTEEERAIAPEATAYALVMVNPIDYYTVDEDGDYTETKAANYEKLTLKIYTDEGIITVDDIAAVAKNGYVKSTRPGVANTVVIEFDEEDVKDANYLDIYTEEDLMQLLSWNIATAKKKTANAKLMADIELTKEALDLLKKNEKLTLKIYNAKDEDYTVTLAEELPITALDYEGLNILAKADMTGSPATASNAVVPVKVAGEIALTKESINLASIEVLKGATLNVNVLNANVPAAVTVNEGATLNIGAAAKTSNTVAITNNGKMNVAAGALVQGAVSNNAELNLNGVANNVANKGIVNMGATAKLLGGTNTTMAEDSEEDAVINMVSGATLDKINVGDDKAGRVKYVDGAIIVHTTATDGTKTSNVNSTVFVEVGGVSIAADTYKNKGVDLWVLTGDINVTACVTLKDVEVAKEATVVFTVVADSTFTATSLTVKKEGAISTNGTLSLTNLTVEKEAEWTNNGTTTISGTLTNNGSVYNNGTAQAGSVDRTKFVGSVNYKEGSINGGQSLEGAVWLQNAFIQKSVDDKAVLLKAVMTEYLTLNNIAVANLAGLNTHLTAWKDLVVAEGGAYYNSAKYGKIYKTEAGDLIAVTEEEYEAAVAAVATEQAANLKAVLSEELTTISEDLINPTVAETSGKSFFFVATGSGSTAKTAVTNAYDVFRNNICKSGVITNWKQPTTVTAARNLIEVGASKLSDTDVAAIIAAKCKFSFIYDDCNMEKLMKVWLDYSDALNKAGLVKGGNSAYYTVASSASVTETNKMAGVICDWALAVLSSTTTDNEVLTAAVTAVKAAGYTSVTSDDSFNGFTDAQVNAIWSAEKGLKQTTTKLQYQAAAAASFTTAD